MQDDAPVLSPDTLRALAHDVLTMSAADTMSVTIHHSAVGMARVALSRVRMQDNGDDIVVSLRTRVGQRATATLRTNQVDRARLRQVVQYLDRAARESSGDPTALAVSWPPRTYLPNTTWRTETAAAFSEARHAAVAELVGPGLDAGLTVSAFVGVCAHSMVYADKHGIMAAGHETDAEMVMTAWTPDGTGIGWAGQADRDWAAFNPASVAARAIFLAARSANPVAVEPGRRTVILDRPAVAQLVRPMGIVFDAQKTFSGWTPLYNADAHRPRLGERVMDARITISSNPNDPEGGCLPFTDSGDPRRAMTWIDRGTHVNLAYDVDFAAQVGYAPSNEFPRALRMDNAAPQAAMTVDAMIAQCQDGIYVNRVAYVSWADADPRAGLLTGVTSGGCFLVRDGKLDKPIKGLRFVDSPWLFLNRLLAIGTTARAPFGYASWAGDWPIDPTIVPPLMVQDFNFTALADTV